jgi:chaperonin GroES
MTNVDVERIQLLGHRILVKPDPPEDRSKGGIWVPDKAKKPTGTGIVVAMGPGLLMKDGSRYPMPAVKPGDRVVFSARDPFPQVELNGVKHLSMYDDSILAVLEPE